MRTPFFYDITKSTLVDLKPVDCSDEQWDEIVRGIAERTEEELTRILRDELYREIGQNNRHPSEFQEPSEGILIAAAKDRGLNYESCWYSLREEFRRKYNGTPPNGYETWGDYWKSY